jgi:hypothetical protein
MLFVSTDPSSRLSTGDPETQKNPAKHGESAFDDPIGQALPVGQS